MEVPTPRPLVSVRDVLPTLGFAPIFGTATDLEPAYAFKGGGVEVSVTQVTGKFLRPEFLIGGTAFNGRSLKYIEQSMPLALESRDQVVAWLAFAVGLHFRTVSPIEWFEEGRSLQHVLPWERRRLELRVEAEKYAQRWHLRPHCVVDRGELRGMLNLGSRAAGWPPAPDRFTLGFDGEMLKLRARSRLIAVQATGAAWPDTYVGTLRDLHALPRRLDTDPVEVGIWDDMLEIGRVRLPVSPAGTASLNGDDIAGDIK
ncbi:hypothetical protein BURK2_04443 [Burkholderiales bacterium]|nr:hypothetical protein BURK2_04443 [Burkholderiales bacterium]